VRTKKERGVLADVQLDAALEANRPRQKTPRRHHHAAAAPTVAVLDRRRDRRRAVEDPVSDRADVRDVERPVGNSRPPDASRAPARLPPSPVLLINWRRVRERKPTEVSKSAPQERRLEQQPALGVKLLVFVHASASSSLLLGPGINHPI